MLTGHLDALDLEEVWSDDDGSLRSKDSYPLFWAKGARSSALVYFELEPGAHLGRHVHSSEETVFVVSGRVEVSVGDQQDELEREGFAVAPALSPHDVRNASAETARCIGFFPSAAIVTVFDDPLMPGGSRVQGTPAPETVLAEEG